MIRINLLEETRVAAGKKSKSSGGGASLPSFDVSENVGVVILVAGVALAIGIVAIFYMMNASTISDLNTKIREAEAEKKRLEYVLKRDKELKARRAELNHRIEIIRKLKKNQGKPVKMMQELSKELSRADNVWFESLNFAKDKVSITGQALSKFNYSKFLKNLEDSPCFVDVRSGIIQEKPGPDGQELVSFKTDTGFTMDCGGVAEEEAESSKGGRK